MIVLLDNGHGVNTPGKRSPDETLFEGRRCRDIVREIDKMLKRRGIKSVILVPEDQDVSLVERCRRANKYDDAILISVHINAAASDGKWHNPNYWSAYTTVGKTEADNVASYLYLSALMHFPGMNIRKDERDGDEDVEENFYILKHTKCPAVLTENFFMDNRAACRWLNTTNGLMQVVTMHVDGIERYLNYKLHYANKR